MEIKNIVTTILVTSALLLQVSCDTKNYSFDEPTFPGGGMGGFGGGGMGDGSVSNDGSGLGIDNTIHTWDGTKASDSSKDVAGSDNDIYHEANSFTKKVTVTFSGNTAQVASTDNGVISHVSDAYVTIDLSSNSLSGVEIELTGKSDAGGLKIYSDKKFKLTLNGVELTSGCGPAINNQSKKRMFLVLADGSENTLVDAKTYTGDPYYLDPSKSEDQKGCIFSEGSIILSGNGTLQVTGLNKHAVATDKDFIMRPGATLVINGAAKNGLHVKGDSDTNIGVNIMGGYIYANISSEAGKAIKTDLNVEISGGVLDLNTSGNAIYDSDENDTSSAAGIKTDGSIILNGGTISVKSTGSGGKGLNSDSDITISGGETTVATNGSKYTYNNYDSSPKGVKADGDITISGGTLKIAASGRNDGAEGLESKAALSIIGGDVEVYAYDDAINAASSIEISGGYVYAYSINNDGIDSSGTLTISGGTVVASGASAPESGLDADSSNWFKINGGSVMAVGGTLQSYPSSASNQYCVSYSSFSASKGAKIQVLDSSSSVLAEFENPRTVSGGNLLISISGFKENTKYSVALDGKSLFDFTPSSTKIITK